MCYDQSEEYFPKMTKSLRSRKIIIFHKRNRKQTQTQVTNHVIYVPTASNSYLQPSQSITITDSLDIDSLDSGFRRHRQCRHSGRFKTKKLTKNFILPKGRRSLQKNASGEDHSRTLRYLKGGLPICMYIHVYMFSSSI